jgi:hypothetical protein
MNIKAVIGQRIVMIGIRFLKLTCAVLMMVLLLFMLYGCGTPDAGELLSDSSTSSPSFVGTVDASSTTTEKPTSERARAQTTAERIYQLEVQTANQQMFTLEETLYECWGVDLEKGLPPSFTEENRAVAAKVAKRADELWQRWKDKKAPSPYYATLHACQLQYMQHFMDGAHQMNAAFNEENWDKFVLAIEEFALASNAKMRGMSESDKLAREQGL